MAAAPQRDTGGANVQGYAFFVGAAVVIVFRAGFDIGYVLGNRLNSPEQVVPSLDYSHPGEDTTPRYRSGQGSCDDR